MRITDPPISIGGFALCAQRLKTPLARECKASGSDQQPLAPHDLDSHLIDLNWKHRRATKDEHGEQPSPLDLLL